MNGRAPKGGITISGIFYRGGQFLPSNNEPKHGMFNRKSTKKQIRENDREQYQKVYTAYIRRITGMQKVWNSPRMRVSKNHPYATQHAIEVFEWHQRFGWD
jgi:hypothetical protein